MISNIDFLLWLELVADLAIWGWLAVRQPHLFIEHNGRTTLKAIFIWGLILSILSAGVTISLAGIDPAWAGIAQYARLLTRGWLLVWGLAFARTGDRH